MKAFGLTGLALLLVLVVVVVPAAANTVPAVVLDGDKVHFKQEPYYANGKLIVEVRALLVKDGLSLMWDASTGTLSASRKGVQLTLKIDSTHATVNGTTHTLTAPAALRGGSVVAALDDLAAMLGKHIAVSENSNHFYVTSSLADRINKLLAHPNIVYEGGLANGKRTGNGKLTLNGNVVYEGQFSADNLHGYGKLYIGGKLVVEGSFSNNLPHGLVDYYWPTGEVYKGDFVNGKMTGEGSLYRGSLLLYSGDWLNDARTGLGRLYSSNGQLLYDGELRNNIRHGFGTLYSGANKIYQGDWVNGRMEGKGLLFDKTGRLAYSGSFVNNEKHGEGAEISVGMTNWVHESDTHVVTTVSRETVFMQYGTYVEGRQLTKSDEIMYVGEKDGNKVPNGKGAFFLKLGAINSRSGVLMNNELLYVGVVRDGEKQGEGIEFVDGAPVYAGTFANNKRHGQGREFTDGILLNDIWKIIGDEQPTQYVLGVMRYDGEWRNGNRHGAGKAFDYIGDVSEYTGNASVVITKGEFFNGQLRRNAAYQIFKYTGPLTYGIMNGYGRLYLLDPASSGSYFNQTGRLYYDGPFYSGRMEGKDGSLYNSSGRRIYLGDFLNDKRHGTGTLYDTNGFREYFGEFYEDKKHGEGTLYRNNIRIYVGSFVNDMKDGQGILYENNVKVYEGSFKEDKKHGYGILYQGSRIIYEGEFINDIRVN